MKLHVVDEGFSDFNMGKDGEEGDIIHHRTFNQEGTKYYRIVMREGKRELVEEEYDFENCSLVKDVKTKKKKKTKHIKPKKLVVKAIKISR